MKRNAISLNAGYTQTAAEAARTVEEFWDGMKKKNDILRANVIVMPKLT